MMHIGNVILLILLFITCYSYIAWIIRSDSNEKWECKKCNVVSRRGIWDLYNSNFKHEQSYHRNCPTCEELTEFEEVYINAPLAPRLNTIKCLKINMAINKNNNAIEADKQLAAYLKVQNKKLEKMNNLKLKDQTQ